VTAGYFEEDVPAQLQDVTTLNPSDKLAKQTRWVIPVNFVTTNLDIMIGDEVSVFADGEVISSPLSDNDTLDTLTVVDNGWAGEVGLPDYYGYGVVGLPYAFEMETLDLEPADGRTFTHEKVAISEIGIALENSRHGLMSQSTTGGDVTKMEEIPYQGVNDLGAAPENFSGHIYRPVQGEWSDQRRVKIKQVDPLPITVLSVYPRGMSGG